MRLKEVRGLLVGDVDLDANEIRLRLNAYRRLKTPKSQRKVPISPALRPVLVTQATGRKPTDLLFTDVDGAMLKDMPRAAWRKACREAALDINPHGARHSYISQAAAVL